MALPEIYLGKSFIETKSQELFGKRSSDLNEYQKKKFDKYLSSEQGTKDRISFNKNDRAKFDRSLQAWKDAAQRQTISDKSEIIASLASRRPIQTTVKTEVTSTLKSNPKRPKPNKRTTVTTSNQKRATQQKLSEDPLSSKSVAEQIADEQSKSKETASAITQRFLNHKNFRQHYNGSKYVAIDGKQYPLMVTTGLYGSDYGIDNDHSYALDPETGKIRKVHEDIFGRVEQTQPGLKWGPKWAENSEWIDINILPGFKKQGGIMKRINYFQQGGQAPQQDIQQQVVALVQAAMQGDEKANQTVTQIMEAAKKGDQQAMQLAQMIQAVVQQMKGQATSAKWGSKLAYIRSLKYAQGGKACPACEKGAPVKVEEKACGGKAKKAKKRYFGGWL